MTKGMGTAGIENWHGSGSLRVFLPKQKKKRALHIWSGFGEHVVFDCSHVRHVTRESPKTRVIAEIL